MSWSQRTSSALELLQILGDKKRRKIGGLVTFHSSLGWWKFPPDLFLSSFPLPWWPKWSESLRWKLNQRPKRLKIWNSKKSQRGFVSCTYDFHSLAFWLRQSYFQLRDETIHASGPFAAEGHFFCSLRLADVRDTNMLQLSTSNQEQKWDLLETSIWRALHIGVNLFGPKNGSTSYAFLAQWMFMNVVSHLDGPEALGSENDDIKISMQTTSNNYRL